MSRPRGMFPSSPTYRSDPLLLRCPHLEHSSSLSSPSPDSALPPPASPLSAAARPPSRPHSSSPPLATRPLYSTHLLLSRLGSDLSQGRRYLHSFRLSRG